jgi:hypothetical protein
MLPIDTDQYPEDGVGKISKDVSKVCINDPAEDSIFRLIEDSGFTKHLADTQPLDIFMNILDGIFASRRYYSRDHRSSKRIKAIMGIMADGFKGSVRMAERDDEVDLLDASSVYSAEYIKSMFYSTLQPEKRLEA